MKLDDPGLKIDQLKKICNLSQQSFSAVMIQKKQLEKQLSYQNDDLQSYLVQNIKAAIGQHRNCIREIAKQTAEWDEIWTSMMEARHSCFILIMFSFGMNELSTLYVRFCQRIFKAGLKQLKQSQLVSVNENPLDLNLEYADLKDLDAHISREKVLGEKNLFHDRVKQLKFNAQR